MNEDGPAQTVVKSVLTVVIAFGLGAGAAVLLTRLSESRSDAGDVVATSTSDPEAPDTAPPSSLSTTSAVDDGSGANDPGATEPSGAVTTDSTATSASTGSTPSVSTAPVDGTTTDAQGTAGAATGGHLEIVATGEVLLQNELWTRAASDGAPQGLAYDYRPMLARIAPMVYRADYGICHLETPIAPDGEEFSPYPEYGVQPEIVEALVDTGYDSCSTASNHALDRGAAGIDRTIEVMKWHMLGFSGTARAPSEIDPSVTEVKGIKVSHLSYSYGFNGISPPSGEDWRVAEIDPERIIADAASARTKGAQVVIVSLHWGVEGQHEITDEQRSIAEQITASGDIDLVIGHHAHVIQPIEEVNGTWVLYGMGNLLSDMPNALVDGQEWPAATQDGAIFNVGIDVDADGEVTVERPTVTPTWVDKENGYVVLPLQAAIESDDYSDAEVAELEESLKRTADVVGSYFAVDPQPEVPASSLDTDVPEDKGAISLA